MRLTTRIVLALAVVALVLFGGFGAVLLRTEVQDLQDASQRTARLVSRALQTSTVYALRDGQLADIEAELERLQQIDPHLHVYVLGEQSLIVQTPNTPPPDSAVQQLAARARKSGEPEYEAPGGLPWSLASRQLQAEPLGYALPAAPLPILVVVQEQDALQSDVTRTRGWVLLAVVLFVAIAALLTLGIGRHYLARPLHRLAAAMEQVRKGDLSSGVPNPRRDEIGEVVDAFNLMVADLRDARIALEQAQQERMREQRALQEVDKLIAIGQLSAGLAHEIGSPLQILTGRARSLTKRATEPDEVVRIAGILVTQTERITRIVEQLLHFARRKPVGMGAVDVPACARQVCDLLEMEAKRRKVDLQLHMDDAVPAVRGNADQVQQVLLNLLTNALHATAVGGTVQVAVRRPAEPEHPGAVRISVQDTGCGIPADVVPRLFEPFFTTREGEGGTGLGLPVVKSIVTEHGGQIHVASTVAKGTRIAVDFPVAAAVTRASELA